MHYIDLTHPFSAAMPVYPGDPAATLTPLMHVTTDGCADHLLTTGMHVGTHIDAPAHMLEGGALIGSYSPEFFATRGICVDARGKSEIGREVFQSITLEKNMAVLVYTGWASRFGSESYFDFTTMPLLTSDAAAHLVEHGVRFLLLDTPTPDVAPFPQHKTLLGNNVLIVENVLIPELLATAGPCEVHVVPLRLSADASPARVYARLFSADVVPPGMYRHYKGHEYTVLGMAQHSETREPMVVYSRPEDNGQYWVRPAVMFTEMVTVDGVLFPRFARIG